MDIYYEAFTNFMGKYIESGAYVWILHLIHGEQTLTFVEAKTFMRSVSWYGIFSFCGNVKISSNLCLSIKSWLTNIVHTHAGMNTPTHIYTHCQIT